MRRGLFTCSAPVLLLSSAVSPLIAATYTVLPDGTGDYPTIQAALTAASTGDTILLGDGVFTGSGNRNLNYLAKTLVVRSESGDPTACTIDCEGAARGFTFVSVTSPAAMLSGVRVINGDGDGSAIYCENSSPTIENCILEDNGSLNRGGGIHCRLGSYPTIRDCVIRNNDSSSGGGLYCYDSGATVTGTVLTNNRAHSVGGGGIFMNVRAVVTLTGCEVTGNSAPNQGGGIYCGGAFTVESDLDIVDCVVSGNEGPFGGGLFINTSHVSVSNTVFTGNASPSVGGAVYVASSSPVFTGCTFAGNHAVTNGGALALYSSNPTFERSILWGDCADGLGEEVHFENAGGSASFTCSVIPPAAIEGTGTVNIDGNSVDADPLFCAPEPCGSAPTMAGEYTLESASPAAPDNSPCGLIGALDVGCGVSAVEDGIVDRTPSASGLLVRAVPNPVPVGSDLQLRIPGAAGEVCRIELFDVDGRRVGSWAAATGSDLVRLGADGLEMGQAQLSPGTYYFRAQVGARVGTGRVSVVR
ncbi:MAG: right-handed parallel beta-helix repeat-containing protein [Candidatus Eisenbacteria bacterium]